MSSKKPSRSACDDIPNRGFKLVEENQFPEAIQYFNIRISENPSNAFNYLGRASARWASGQKKRALHDYHTAAENMVFFNSWPRRFTRVRLMQELSKYRNITNSLNELSRAKAENTIS